MRTALDAGVTTLYVLHGRCSAEASEAAKDSSMEEHRPEVEA